MSRLRRFLRDAADSGASAVEYGLMIAAIAAVVVGAVFGFGGIVKQTVSQTSACIEHQGVGDPYPNC